MNIFVIIWSIFGVCTMQTSVLNSDIYLQIRQIFFFSHSKTYLQSHQKPITVKLWKEIYRQTHSHTHSIKYPRSQHSQNKNKKKISFFIKHGTKQKWAIVLLNIIINTGSHIAGRVIWTIFTSFFFPAIHSFYPSTGSTLLPTFFFFSFFVIWTHRIHAHLFLISLCIIRKKYAQKAHDL